MITHILKVIYCAAMKNKKNELLSKFDKRPIAKFYRCWLQDVANNVLPKKCRGINHEQFKAADRIACSYQRSIKGQEYDFSKVKIDKTNFRNYHIEVQVHAFHEYMKVFGKLNKTSQKIIKHVCNDELPVRQFELKQIPIWVKGAGTTRLREALDELTDIYRRL